jgi:hypothetical protein
MLALALVLLALTGWLFAAADPPTSESLFTRSDVVRWATTSFGVDASHVLAKLVRHREAVVAGIDFTYPGLNPRSPPRPEQVDDGGALEWVVTLPCAECSLCSWVCPGTPGITTFLRATDPRALEQRIPTFSQAAYIGDTSEWRSLVDLSQPGTAGTDWWPWLAGLGIAISLAGASQASRRCHRPRPSYS